MEPTKPCFDGASQDSLREAPSNGSLRNPE
jgi:hypothetical protein